MNAIRDDLPGSIVAGFSAMTEESWKNLFRDLRHGNREAMESLYDLASRRLFGLAVWRTGSRDDACDVVQEVFTRVAENRDTLDKIRNPRAWLLSVTHRVAVDVTRKRSRQRAEPLSNCRFLEADTDDAERSVDASRASKLIEGLPPAQRETVYLRNHAGCSFAEIGRITGVPTFTAAGRYRLGLARLKRWMEGKR